MRLKKEFSTDIVLLPQHHHRVESTVECARRPADQKRHPALILRIGHLPWGGSRKATLKQQINE